MVARELEFAGLWEVDQSGQVEESDSDRCFSLMEGRKGLSLRRAMDAKWTEGETGEESVCV